ncbi:homeobox protein TGIF1 [Platysternon megacephalum]|uniref:Homeobox protein TGIF1 n=1 Tax=Platysternon megacephalum TaxID=55544 RepID=A0A4D9EMI5_9SAUR|nr:homeobox protein TGIF1 [Platysternon megacephalum]
MKNVFSAFHPSTPLQKANKMTGGQPGLGERSSLAPPGNCYPVCRPQEPTLKNLSTDFEGLWIRPFHGCHVFTTPKRYLAEIRPMWAEDLACHCFQYVFMLGGGV